MVGTSCFKDKEPDITKDAQPTGGASFVYNKVNYIIGGLMPAGGAIIPGGGVIPAGGMPYSRAPLPFLSLPPVLLNLYERFSIP